MSQADADRAYMSVIDIAVPSETKWQPKAAQQFISSLFSIPEILKLMIGATNNGIKWGIEVGQDYEQLALNAIHATCPQAQVEITPKKGCHIGYWLFHIYAANPFIGPLKYAEDFDHLDPLASVVEAMANIGPNEEIIYEITLSSPRQNYIELGEKLLTRSNIHWMEYTSFTGAIAASRAKSQGADRVDRYTPEISQIARKKLDLNLKEVVLGIKIKSATRDRVANLITVFEPVVDLFHREKFNFLVVPDEDTYPLVLSANEVAALWHLPTNNCQTPGIIWAGREAVAAPTAVTSLQEGVVLGVNSYRGKKQNITLAHPDRLNHTYLAGSVRTGKSTLLHRMIHQDIESGKGVAVIDPRGDLFNAILTSSIPPEREQDVILFDVTDLEYAVGLNLLTMPPGLSEGAIVGSVLDAFEKLFADSWSQRIENLLYISLRALMTYRGATILDVPELLLNKDFRTKVLEGVNDPIVLQEWQRYEKLNLKDQQEWAEPINYRIGKFSRKIAIRRIVCQQKSLDFRDILDSNKIFLANLEGGSEMDEFETSALGTFLISKIKQAAMRRTGFGSGGQWPFFLYIDEIQNFMTKALPKMLSEAGKYGFGLVVANQLLHQLKTNDHNTSEIVLGEVGTIIIFRVNPQDASDLGGLVQPNFDADDLVKLERYHTVVKMRAGGKSYDAFSMMTLPPIRTPDDARDRFIRITQKSRDKYAQPTEEIDKEFLKRWQSDHPDHQND